MAEKQGIKKRGSTKRVSKWIGLAVLSVLIILGLIFEAPWKAITLLLIVLAACRILPKPAIKWFWLSVGVVVIALIIWVFLPDRKGDWRPYTFDEELAAIEAKRAIPNSENAATIYNKLLEVYDSNAMYPDFLKNRELDRSTIAEPWSSKEYPQIAEWLKSHENTIATLMDASKIEKCRFPIAADSAALSQTMKRLSAMRSWARLLIRAASNDLGEDQPGQALEKQIALLQMTAHLYQQPTMIDMLVGIAIEALAIQQFNGFMVTGDATEAHLSVIEKALADIKHDWSYDLARILEGEKPMMKNLFSMFYEVNPKGRVRLTRDPTAAIKTQFPQFPQEIRPLTYWRKKLMKAKTISGWFYMPSTPEKAAEIIDASYERLHAMAESDFDWKKEPRKFPITRFRFNYRYLIENLAGMLEEPYYKIHDQYLRVHSVQRASRLMITLRRYKNKNGIWPESLDDIKSLAPLEAFVDPTNGSEFVYKLTDDTFKLYSKGKNNIDENGLNEQHYLGKDKPDDWLIWPRKNRKTKEKKANAEQH